MTNQPQFSGLRKTRLSDKYKWAKLNKICVACYKKIAVDKRVRCQDCSDKINTKQRERINNKKSAWKVRRK